MKEFNRKIQVTDSSQPDEKELQEVRDFSRIVTRLDEARKPLPKRKLYQSKQRWFFLAILLIILILLILLEVF